MAAAATSRIVFNEFAKIGLQVGQIVKAVPFPKARNPSYQVTVDFGDRTLTTSAQLPSNYPDIQSLFGKTVIGITNLPERRIGGFKSQFLMVGFPDAHGHVQLLNTREKAITVGSYLYPTNDAKPMIDYDHFKKAAIHSGTVTKVKELSEDSFAVSLDMGEELGERETVLVDVPKDIVDSLEGTQVAVLINLEKDCIHDPETIILTAPLNDRQRMPLGVDCEENRMPANGAELF